MTAPTEVFVACIGPGPTVHLTVHSAMRQVTAHTPAALLPRVRKILGAVIDGRDPHDVDEDAGCDRYVVEGAQVLVSFVSSWVDGSTSNYFTFCVHRYPVTP